MDNVLPQFKVALMAMTGVPAEMDPSTKPNISTTYPTITRTPAISQTPMPSTTTSPLPSPLPSEPEQSQQPSVNSPSASNTSNSDPGFPVIAWFFLIILFLVGFASFVQLRQYT